jgi:hypothetical protein
MLSTQCRSDFYAVQYAGTWMVAKLRRQARTAGVFHMATMCRKRGMPLALTLRILGAQQ